MNITQLGDAGASYWAGVERFHAHLPALSDAGASGYYWVIPNLSSPEFGHVAATAVIFYFVGRNDTAIVDEAFAPLLSSLKKISGLHVQYSSWQLERISDMYKDILQGGDETGTMTVLGSRLISRTLLGSTHGSSKLISTLRKLKDYDGVPVLGHLVAGGQVAKNKDIDVSIHPAWRRALVHLVIPRGWSKDTPFAEQRAIQANLTNVEVPLLKQLEQGMGAYTNEADVNEKDFQESFWGSNYRRLYRVKAKWDPRHLFIVRAGVGSEHWDEQGLCRVR